MDIENKQNSQVSIDTALVLGGCPLCVWEPNELVGQLEGGFMKLSGVFNLFSIVSFLIGSGGLQTQAPL